MRLSKKLFYQVEISLGKPYMLFDYQSSVCVEQSKPKSDISFYDMSVEKLQRAGVNINSLGSVKTSETTRLAQENQLIDFAENLESQTNKE